MKPIKKIIKNILEELISNKLSSNYTIIAHKLNTVIYLVDDYYDIEATSDLFDLELCGYTNLVNDLYSKLNDIIEEEMIKWEGIENLYCEHSWKHVEVTKIKIDDQSFTVRVKPTFSLNIR